MAKKKKKKMAVEPEGLEDIFEIGDECECRAVLIGDEERSVVKTPVRVIRVGKEYLGLRIRGKSLQRKFTVGAEIHIENFDFKVISVQGKMEATVKYIEEDED